MRVNVDYELRKQRHWDMDDERTQKRRIDSQEKPMI